MNASIQIITADGYGQNVAREWVPGMEVIVDFVDGKFHCAKSAG